MVIRQARADVTTMDAFLISTGVVALAEMGDKTQLLALMLAARYQRPLPIISGIFVATLVNHALAGAVGAWLTEVLGPDILRWIVGVSFIAMAGWALIPDKLDSGPEKETSRYGLFATTVMTFFLAEMADKTQIATVALTARFHAFYPVVIGTTFGMMIANVPAVLMAERLAQKVPVRIVRALSSLLFLVLGILALIA